MLCKVQSPGTVVLVVLVPAVEDISAVPARHIYKGAEMREEPAGTRWMALQVHSSRHLREVWQILGLHQGAGMIIISQWLVKHPSVQRRIRNGWQLSEEFCLKYTVHHRSEFAHECQESKSDKFKQKGTYKKYTYFLEECQILRHG